MEAKKRWEVESKLPIKSLWERWEGLAWVLSRNNTGKELVPHLEGGGRSLSSEDLATDQLFPLVLFFRRKKKKSPLSPPFSCLYVFRQDACLLWPSPLCSVRRLWYFSQGRDPSEGWVFLFRLLLWVSHMQQAVDRNSQVAVKSGAQR